TPGLLTIWFTMTRSAPLIVKYLHTKGVTVYLCLSSKANLRVRFLVLVDEQHFLLFDFSGFFVNQTSWYIHLFRK
ncbi:hypothetical protein, partial [Scytonema millei]|uniref:hypothetical protein n=1 Tax=Scytonema millei TaxID=1245922 RepID=UPI00398C2085